MTDISGAIYSTIAEWEAPPERLVESIALDGCWIG